MKDSNFLTFDDEAEEFSRWENEALRMLQPSIRKGKVTTKFRADKKETNPEKGTFRRNPAKRNYVDETY